jgi:hypothetical protein
LAIRYGYALRGLFRHYFDVECEYRSNRYVRL